MSSTTTKASTITSKPISATSTTSKPTTTSTATPLPNGSACGSNSFCQSGYCRAKLNPDGTRSNDATCEVKKASGAAFYQNAGCLSGTCSIAKGDVSGICK
ncbi:hypothetical protein CF336_g7831 [Tilletia laevis]|uniref:Uncharacterized protein n=1 Tax=Tilletia caries TaxID=13290 RepID=A0A177TGW1_9BASI|nr:hypothetical protein CF336_g7831 [Tilletia laevis]KAE8185622.1 hypothetical protein CF335_g7670 [Tilletia laevis]KAE8243367.1 hypothetical protein A4X03_0g7784 [Tilletia caries]